MSDIVEYNAQLPAHLAGEFDDDDAGDLISGTGGFPVMSIRGSKWRVKVEGEEHALRNAETGDPVPSVELVIISAQKGLSKIYYQSEYKEGDDSPPACYSVEGDVPDPGSESVQARSCADCPQNVWGSKITPQGNKTKACSDAKRMVVSFASNMQNEAMGGPMLLRVPAASLKDLSAYARNLKAKKCSYQKIVVRLGFDMDASYPKLTFKAVRRLSTNELEELVSLRHHDNVEAILGGNAHELAAKPKPPVKPPTVDTTFDANPVPAPQVTIAPIKKAAPVPEAITQAKADAPVVKKAAPRKAAPASVPETSAFDDLDSIIGDLQVMASPE